MPFHLADEPPDCRRALLSGISRLGTALFSPARLARLESAAPIPIWSLEGTSGPFSLDKSVTPVGFAYLLLEGERAVGVSEVVKRVRGHWELASVSTAPARVLAHAIERAGGHRDFRRGNFEVRWLRAPVQHVEAIWFFSAARSLFWVLPPAVRRLKIRNPCPPERFLTRLHAQAPLTPVPKTGRDKGPLRGLNAPE